MRCLQCFKATTEDVCLHCGRQAAIPTAEVGCTDVAEGLLAALTDVDHPVDEALIDLWCLALTMPGAADSLERGLASVVIDELSPEKQCLVATHRARRTDEEAQAAATFTTVLDPTPGTISAASAVFESRAREGSLVEVWLHLRGRAHQLGLLDKEHVQWTDCQASEIDMSPDGWASWLEEVRRLTCAASQTAQALSESATGVAPDSGFRSLWKAFQTALGEDRDSLEAPPEHAILERLAVERDRAGLRQLDVPKAVSSLVDASRNALRVRADSIRAERVREVELCATEAFSRVFIEGGLKRVEQLQEEVRTEIATAHAELRKSLDYQGRLLRSAQEALNTSLSELSRKAAGLLWPLTPQRLFDDAREQAELVLERSREVAMIEMTDAYLQSLSPVLDGSAGQLCAELSARRALLDAWQHGLERLTRALLLQPTASEVADPPATLREWFRSSQPTAQGMGALLRRVTFDSRKTANASA